MTQITPPQPSQQTQPPIAQPIAPGQEPRNRGQVLSVATNQKGVLLALLIQVICGISMAFLASRPELKLYPMAVGMIAGLVGAAFVFKLANDLYGPVKGIILALLTLVPLVSLLVLLIVNSKALAILKQAGVKVGLLGANLREI